MVSLHGHILPVIVTVATWFLATGAVVWIDNRDRATFPASLALAGLAGLAGLAAILVVAGTTGLVPVYVSYAGALLVWGWHEVGFLTGAITGPRQRGCPGSAGPWQRFCHACAALAWHEIALAATAAALLALTLGAPTPLGAQVFALMLAMRLSTKINIFLGVPNMSSEILPPQLAYLKSYFGPRRLTPLLPLAIAGHLALAAWLGQRALAAPAGAGAAATSLLFGLVLLGTLEHVFLALPFRDGALWNWALPSRRAAR